MRSVQEAPGDSGMKDMEKNVTVSLDGAFLTIDGEHRVVESGEMRITREFLYSADDPPGDPTTVAESIEIDVECLRPDND